MMSLARLFRLVTGMQKKQCPVDIKGNCYWCEAPIIFQRTYVGDLRGSHYPECPWIEVIDYASLRKLLEENDVPGAKADDQLGGAGPTGAADGDAAAARPVRPDSEKGTADA